MNGPSGIARLPILIFGPCENAWRKRMAFKWKVRGNTFAMATVTCQVWQIGVLSLSFPPGVLLWADPDLLREAISLDSR